MPFNGKPGPGRPKGAVNERTKELKRFVDEIIDDPEYRAMLKKRANAGILAPAVEQTLLYYKFGKPVDKAEIKVVDDTQRELAEKTAAELALEAAQLARGILAAEKEEAEKQKEAETLADFTVASNTSSNTGDHIH